MLKNNKVIEYLNFNNYFPELGENNVEITVSQENSISVSFGISKDYEKNKQCIIEIEIEISELTEDQHLYRDVSLKAFMEFELEELSDDKIFVIYFEFLTELLKHISSSTGFEGSSRPKMSFEKLIEQCSSEKDSRKFIPDDLDL